MTTSEERTQLEMIRADMHLIDAKVDRLLTFHEYELKQRDDHELRIRSVEKWKLSIPISMILAIATIVGVALGKG